jgi:hypothetical protein
MPIGSINEQHTEARSPGVWSSRCLLHKQFGQWFLLFVPGASSGTSSRQ